MVDRSSRGARGFQLTVHPNPTGGDGRFAVALTETNGRNDYTREVARLPADRLEVAGDALADALRASRQPRTALTATRRNPIALADDAGVRLALTVNAIHGITKPRRATQLLRAVGRMSDEECFYWYAHTIGATDPATRRRRFKALRIFLAEE